MGTFVVKSRCHRQLLVPYYILLQVYVSNTVHISCTVDITHVLCTRLYTFHILTRTLGRRDRRDREAQLLGHVVRQAISLGTVKGKQNQNTVLHSVLFTSSHLTAIALSSPPISSTSSSVSTIGFTTGLGGTARGS